MKSGERKFGSVILGTDCNLLGTGMDTQDTSPSVLLFFEKQRFIFNVEEILLKLIFWWSFVALDRAVWFVFSVLLSKGHHMNYNAHKNHIYERALSTMPTMFYCNLATAAAQSAQLGSTWLSILLT
ncbi:unnamed protein product [Prunus armeniaca]